MNESIDYLHEVFDAFGPIRARRMFGGWGIYHDGLMFGLYAAGRLYLKTDTHNVAQFEAAGCEPFTYNQRGKVVKLSYWSAPEAVLDEREQAVIWARTAFEAALRAHAAKMKLKTKTK
jgi:DNA transformation protein and related proteins